ncbi:hypothetical protein MPRS_30120 [Mycobacterium paraseoulense]|nr:hypothetical protein MPRS_30120 [Mycobacterium paraseoulense]
MSDNGYAFSIPSGLGMSHNRRTLQDMGPHVLERQLTRQNGGPGVRMDSAVMPEADTGFRSPTGRFVVVSAPSWPSIQPNLQQSVRENKTVGLVTQERV